MTDKQKDGDKPTLTLSSGTLGAGKLTLGAGAGVPKRPAAPPSGVQVEVVGAKRKSSVMKQSGGNARSGGLTRKEQEVRLKALQAASELAEERKRADEINRAKQEEEARLAAEKQAEQEEAERAARKEEARLLEASETTAEPLSPETDTGNNANKTADATATKDSDDDTADRFTLDKKTRSALEALQQEQEDAALKEKTKPKSALLAEKKKARISVTQVLSEEAESIDDTTAALGADVPRRRVKRFSAANKGKRGRFKADKVLLDVEITETIEVSELANRMAVRVHDVVRALMKMGVMAAPSHRIDADTAELAVSEFGHRPVRVKAVSPEEALFTFPEKGTSDNEQSRAPVVTFMGHVDHGKTSLLDAIRSAKVTDGEAGGITQHIGAYKVPTSHGSVTFLDTPGHEAFTDMRKRGAGATDIVILVVAADDGIMKQTEEAISHAKAAGAPIIVAINKIDKPAADPQKIRTSLLNYELIAEELGGDIMTVEVSAKTGAGLDKLLEAISLQAEIMELSADPEHPAIGTVIEARMDKYRGAISTILVQHGTLRVGDVLVSDKAYGKIRSMTDDDGKRVHTAGPSDAVEILGLNDAPLAGSPAAVADSEKAARDIADIRILREREGVGVVTRESSMDVLLSQIKGGGVSELPVLIKGDVQGSVEAIEQSLMKLNTDEVAVRVLHKGVGGITESDISLAGTSSAMVLGFNVRAENAAKNIARRDNIDIQYYSIIYDLIDDVKNVLSGMLKPEIRENMLGYAEIRDVFNITKVGKVAGCYVTEGNVRRSAGVRLLRDNVVIHEGTLKTLRRFKDDVKEVASGYECGIAFERYDDIKPGDFVEVFEVVEEKRSL